jgi:hypothetical protein
MADGWEESILALTLPFRSKNWQQISQKGR